MVIKENLEKVHKNKRKMRITESHLSRAIIIILVYFLPVFFLFRS